MEKEQIICNCIKIKCIRHGKCEECLEYHRVSKRPPYCRRFSKKGLNRPKQS